MRTVDDWTEVFVDAVLKHAEFTCKDSRTANHHFDRSIDAWRVLIESGEAGLCAVTNLLEHENAVVRVRAATYLLPHRTDEAVGVLTAAKQAGDPLALVTLERWKRGFYVDPLTGREVAV